MAKEEDGDEEWERSLAQLGVVVQDVSSERDRACGILRMAIRFPIPAVFVLLLEDEHALGNN